MWLKRCCIRRQSRTISRERGKVIGTMVWWNNFFHTLRNLKLLRYFKNIWLLERIVFFRKNYFDCLKKNRNNLNYLNFNYSNLIQVFYSLSQFGFDKHRLRFMVVRLCFKSSFFSLDNGIFYLEYRKKGKYIEWNVIIKKTSRFLGPAYSFRLEASRSAFSIRCTNSSQTPSPCRLLSCLHDASRRTLHASALSDVERRRPLLLIYFLFFLFLWINFE